jgi:hypothetical protein
MGVKVVEQVVTFWFVINDIAADDVDGIEKGQRLCDAAVVRIDDLQAAHPLREYKQKQGKHVLTFRNWDFRIDYRAPEDQDGKLAWPIEFTCKGSFNEDVLPVILDLCKQGFTEAAHKIGGSAVCVNASAYSLTHDTVRTKLPLTLVREGGLVARFLYSHL